MPSTLFPVLFLLLLKGLSLLSLAVRPSPFRWIFWFPIAGIAYYVIFYTSTGSANNYGIACMAASEVVLASDYILLTDVQRELFLVGQQKPISDAPFLSRLRWALTLSFSPRGVGWTHEPKSMLRPHPPPTTSRIAFIISQSFWMLFYILLFDATTLYTADNPSFVISGHSLAADGWFWRFVNATVVGVQATCQISKQYVFFHIVTVALGSTPQECPPIFGLWRDAYTLRKFWGRSWHQLMRRMVSSHGKFLTHIFHFTHGTNASSYVQLYTAFFLSGMIHWLGDYMLLGNWTGGGLRFFMLQAVVIMCEDGVIAFASDIVGVKSRWWKMLGYLWVLMWFAYSVPAWQDPMIEGGMDETGQHYHFFRRAWQALGTWNGI